MASNNELHWGEEDSKAAKRYLEDLASGKVKSVLVTRENLNTIFK